MRDCEFWSPYLAWSGPLLRGAQPISPVLRYRKILEMATEIYGSDIVVVDSTKTTEGLDIAVEAVPSLKTIHLVKDVRSFVYGVQRRQKKAAPWWGAIYSAYWWHANRNIDRTIAELGLKSIRVGYEELCFDEAALLKRVYNFANLLAETALASSGPGRNHLAIGNRMKVSADLAGDLTYDHRWLWSKEPRLAPLLRGSILARNTEWVYSNLSSFHKFSERKVDGHRVGG